MTKQVTKLKKAPGGMSGWGTKNEINFLTKIGTFGKQHKDPKPLLAKYIEAAEERHNWGKIDSEEVIRTARAMHDSL